MGYTKVDNSFRREVVPRLKLRPSDVAVYEALVGRANAQGVCWPSRELIARESGVSSRTVYTVCRRLEEAGLITMKQSHGRRGNVVTITPLNPATIARFTQPGNPATISGPTRQPLPEKDYPGKDSQPPRAVSPLRFRPRPSPRESAPTAARGGAYPAPYPINTRGKTA